MGLISEEITIDSIRITESMNLTQKVSMCDRIYCEQPYLFQELLILSHSGMPLQKMEHLYHLLMVCHTAFKKAMSNCFKTIEIRDIDAVVENNKKMFDFFELEPDKRAMQLSIKSYPEQYLLAYLIDYLTRNGIKGQTEEDVKVVFMAKVILDSYVHVHKKTSN